MRLIDADKAIGHIKTRLLETALNNSTAVCDVAYVYQECADNRIETWVDEIPTVDAEPVVRCIDCCHHEVFKEPGMVYCPKIVGDWVENNFFCKDGSRGEKR